MYVISPKYKREEIFYLNQGQLWKLCEDANLVTQSLTLTNIARIFSTVKIQFASSIAIARRRREAHANGQDEGKYNNKYKGDHGIFVIVKFFHNKSFQSIFLTYFSNIITYKKNTVSFYF